MLGGGLWVASWRLCIWPPVARDEYPAMATEFSMIGIMNAALLAQGQDETIAENDGSLEFRTLSSNWPLIVESELEDGNYYFTKEEAHLITRADGKYGYDDAYLVPHDALHVRRLWLLTDTGERYETDWVQDGQYVHLNNPNGCWIEYVDVTGQNLWSANFSKGITIRLEALILRSIKEEFTEAEARDGDAEVVLQRARTNSAKARRAKPAYRKGPIALARNRRG